MPPGPGLAAVLGTLNRARLNGHDLVVVLEARARQLAHDQAELLADMVEVGHCPPGDTDSAVTRQSEALPYAEAEIAFALTLTRVSATNQLDLARQVVERFPQLYRAMAAGLITEHKARIFSNAVTVVDDDLAHQVINKVLPEAPRLTTGQLAAKLRRLIKLDPDAAAERYRRGVRDRQVQLWPNDDDGTAALAGFGLPADRAASAAERIDAYARAAKRAGHDDGRTLEQIRADVFLDLLNGTHTGPAPVHRAGVVELTVPLTTLMGLANRPGELAGFGTVTADVARQIAERQQDAVWRFSVVNPRTGQVVHSGRTNRRPTQAVSDTVVARDRQCRAPGCRAPASRTDLDHTVDHARDGPSEAWNLGPLCRYHHRMKHQGHYRLRRAGNGLCLWITPQGHHHLLGPEPAEDPEPS